MAATATSKTLAPKTRVVATVDLKGVPRGTVGKVIHVQGLTWIRYWVHFDNGLRVGTLHRDKLATLDEWENRSSTGSTAVAAVASGGAVSEAAGAPESIGGVPIHLIERSKNARARWAAKSA